MKEGANIEKQFFFPFFPFLGEKEAGTKERRRVEAKIWKRKLCLEEVSRRDSKQGSFRGALHYVSTQNK